MLTDDLKKLGQTISDEFNVGRSSTTQRWMAHYIAELMQRAEKSRDTNIGVETEERCANLILELWGLNKERERIRIQSQIYARFNEIYEKRPNVDEIKKIIESPEQINEVTEQTAKDVILLCLNNTEEDLLRLQIIGSVVSNIDRNAATEEALKEANTYVQVYQTTIQHLKDIWPEAEELSIENVDSTQSFVSTQLRRIQFIRNRLIGI